MSKYVVCTSNCVELCNNVKYPLPKITVGNIYEVQIESSDCLGYKTFTIYDDFGQLNEAPQYFFMVLNHEKILLPKFKKGDRVYCKKLNIDFTWDKDYSIALWVDDDLYSENDFELYKEPTTKELTMKELENHFNCKVKIVK